MGVLRPDDYPSSWQLQGTRSSGSPPAVLHQPKPLESQAWFHRASQWLRVCSGSCWLARTSLLQVWLSSLSCSWLWLQHLSSRPRARLEERRLEATYQLLDDLARRRHTVPSGLSTSARTSHMALPSTRGAGDGHGNQVVSNCPCCQVEVQTDRPQSQEVWDPGHCPPKPFVYVPILHSVLILFAHLFVLPT